MHSATFSMFSIIRWGLGAAVRITMYTQQTLLNGVDLCRLSGPPSLPKAGLPRAASSGLCPAGHWACKDRNSTPTLGNVCQCWTSSAMIKNRVFFLLFKQKFRISLWEKCVSAFPCPGIYAHSSQSVCWPPASPGPFPQSCFPPTSSSACTDALGFFLPNAGLCISFVELYKFPVGWSLSFPAWLNTNMISTFASLPRHLKAAEIPAIRSERNFISDFLFWKS